MEHSEWQLKQSTHRDRFKYAFDNSLFCDIEFLVVDCDGKRVTVPANKYPLAVCSPVFEAMFYGKLAETKSSIHIPDCTKEGLQEILRYAHYEEASLTGSNVMEVFYLAKKYMMPSLEKQCQQFIKNEVGPEDVLYVLPQVQKMVDENLEKHFWKIIDKKTEQVILSKPFVNVPRELLCEILKRDNLKVQELNLFKAVDNWVTKRIEDKELVCNGETKRDILGEDIIRLIRFPCMTQREVAEVVLPCKILNVDEVTELVSIFSGMTPATEMFSRKERLRALGELLVSDIRFQTFKQPDAYHPCWFNYDGAMEDSLDFNVNNAVDLVGVKLFGNEGKTYKVNLEICKIGQSLIEVISNLSSSYTTEEEKINGLYYGFTVTLDKPVRLAAGVTYRITTKIQGPCPRFGVGGKTNVSAGDQITITYKTSPGFKTNHSTSSSLGQFPSFVLRKSV